MSRDDVEIVRRGWEAVARHDLETVALLLDPGVRWHGAHDEEHEGEGEGEGCNDRAEALAFLRQALAAGVVAEPLEIREAGDRVLVVAQASKPPEEDAPTDPHGELVTVCDGKIVEILVFHNVEAALAAEQQTG